MFPSLGFQTVNSAPWAWACSWLSRKTWRCQFPMMSVSVTCGSIWGGAGCVLMGTGDSLCAFWCFLEWFFCESLAVYRLGSQIAS